MDEQWSYVGSKANQRWLWYAWSPPSKTGLAYAFGPRQDNVLRVLLQRLNAFRLLFVLYR